MYLYLPISTMYIYIYTGIFKPIFLFNICSWFFNVYINLYLSFKTIFYPIFQSINIATCQTVNLPVSFFIYLCIYIYIELYLYMYRPSIYIYPSLVSYLSISIYIYFFTSLYLPVPVWIILFDQSMRMHFNIPTQSACLLVNLYMA